MAYYQLVGDKIVLSVIKENKNPNEEIIKIAISGDFTDDQIKRIIEYVNVKLFNEFFKLGKTDFDVADPNIIFKELKREKALKKSASFNDVLSSILEGNFEKAASNEMFNSAYETSNEGLTLSNKLPKWMREKENFVKTSSQEKKEINKLAAQNTIQKLLSGKDYKIPTISKIAKYLTPGQIENLEFKKFAGCEESDELADKFIEAVKWVG
ncbi:MAG: hypothetical protein QXW35_04355 [Candidatus Aenigmatarchaeota archaeon]